MSRRNNLFSVVLSVVSVFILVSSQTVSALSPEQKRLYDSGVLQFDIETEENKCSENVSINLTGNSNAAKAFNFLVGQGLTDAQAAGVVGNLQAESSIIPNRKQGSGMQTISSIDQVQPGTGYGIAQWTSGGRQIAWKNFAKEKNMDPLSLELQLLYLWHELETVPGYGLEEISKATDLRQAAWVFLVFFERPAATSGFEEKAQQATSGTAKEELDRRVALANQVTGGGGDAADTTSSSPESSCEDTAAGGATLRVSTFNIFHIDSEQTKEFWVDRLRRSTDVITSNNLDVVGLQEARHGQQDELMTPAFLGGKYGIYPKTTKGNDFSPNPIIWDSTRWELVEKGSKKFKITYDGNFIDVATQVKLKETGCTSACTEIYVLNTHDPASVRKGTDAIRNANSRIYVDMIKELDKEGLPIFLTGDFNSPYSDEAHCIISDSGVIKDTWELFKNIKGCANKRDEGSAIDRIYASPDTTVSKFWSAKAGKTDGNGSDKHATIMAEVKVGGDEEGVYSANGYTFPLKTSRSTIVGNAQSVWCHKSTSNCHHDYNAADIFVPTGTPVVAMKGGRVQSAKDNATDPSQVGTRVAIMGDDGNLYYYAHMGNNTLKVRDGQKVKAGDELGKVGTRENAVGTDPHLHIDRLPGAQNPSRPYCSGAACKSYPFFNIQGILSEVFKSVK